MLHPVSDRPRQVIRQERVGAGVERRIFAEDRCLFGNDPAQAVDTCVLIGRALRVQRQVHRRARLEAPGRRCTEGAQDVTADLDRAVDQVRENRAP